VELPVFPPAPAGLCGAGSGHIVEQHRRADRRAVAHFPPGGRAIVALSGLGEFCRDAQPGDRGIKRAILRLISQPI